MGNIRVRLGYALDYEVARMYPVENKIAGKTDGAPYPKLLYEKATSEIYSV